MGAPEAHRCALGTKLIKPVQEIDATNKRPILNPSCCRYQPLRQLRLNRDNCSIIEKHFLNRCCVLVTTCAGKCLGRRGFILAAWPQCVWPIALARTEDTARVLSAALAAQVQPRCSCSSRSGDFCSAMSYVAKSLSRRAYSDALLQVLAYDPAKRHQLMKWLGQRHT